MPPPRGTTNVLERPGDYDVTSTIHTDTYPAIDPAKQDFSDKAIFIVGGSKGIGRAITLSFAKAGASHIAVGARSDLSQLEKDVISTAQPFNRPAPHFLAIKLDLEEPKTVDDALASVEKEFGRCDVLINCAGSIGKFGRIADSDPDVWWQVMTVNLRGPYLLSRTFLPLMLKGGDRYIVHVASVGAHLVSPTLSAYQTSKLALLRLSQFIDGEYGDQGVTSFCIHPGNAVTDIIGGSVDKLADNVKPAYVDTVNISAVTTVFLTSEKRQWLGGRYINVTWDMPELMSKKDEILKGDLLKVRLAF